MNSHYKIMAIIYLFCSVQSAYPMAAFAKVAARASIGKERCFNQATQVTKNFKAGMVPPSPSAVMQAALLRAKNIQVPNIAAIKAARESVNAKILPIQQLLNRTQATCANNPFKVLFGGGVIGGVVGGAYCANSANPYEQRLRDEFLNAVSQDDAALVASLSSIDTNEEMIRTALQQHALTNVDQIQQEVAKEMKKNDPKVNDFAIKSAAQAAAKANIETFGILLSKVKNPEEFVNKVVKGGDANKVMMLLHVGIPVETLLARAIKVEKNRDLTALLLQKHDATLSADKAFIRATHLYDRSLIKEIMKDPFNNMKLRKSFWDFDSQKMIENIQNLA